MEPRVLVVDDDAVVGTSFDRVLSEKGYRVDVAMSGKEAFEKFDGKDFDLVFTDLRMPGQDGLEFAKRIREMNPWLPVVVVTGYGTVEAEERAKELGLAGFLHKPVTPEGILETASRVTREFARRTVGVAEETTAPAADEGKENVARNVALFFAAPFIGLAYMLAFPFIGTWMIGRWGFRALRDRGRG
jgi:CheY-like chemotaxis protein